MSVKILPGAIALALAAIAAAPAAQAHHSSAVYDLSREVAFTGTVAQLDWKNPHVYLTLETRDPDGRRRLQKVEGQGLAELRISGLGPEKLRLGSRVEVRAAPNRSGDGRIVFGLDVTTADGAVYPLSPYGKSSVRPATTAAATIAGRWAPSVDAARAYMETSLAAPLTEAGREAMEQRLLMPTPDVGCDLTKSAGGVIQAFMGLPLVRTIDEIGADTVVISVDYVVASAVRTIHLDQERHPDGLAPSQLGHSIGHWEGRSLVIETVGMAGPPQGKILERLSLADDGRQLRYEITLDFPGWLTEPTTRTELWEHRPDLEPTSAVCDPENAREYLKDLPEESVARPR
jgi:hypothetical protein